MYLQNVDSYNIFRGNSILEEHYVSTVVLLNSVSRFHHNDVIVRWNDSPSVLQKMNLSVTRNLCAVNFVWFQQSAFGVLSAVLSVFYYNVPTWFEIDSSSRAEVYPVIFPNEKL